MLHEVIARALEHQVPGITAKHSRSKHASRLSVAYSNDSHVTSNDPEREADRENPADPLSAPTRAFIDTSQTFNATDLDALRPGGREEKRPRVVGPLRGHAA